MRVQADHFHPFIKAAVQNKCGSVEKIQNAAVQIKLRLDSNHDGVVDLNEFVAAGGDEQDFKKYDVNHDGNLYDADIAAIAAAQ